MMSDGITIAATDINAVFLHKVCINLDRRPERWKQSQQEFARHGIHGVRRFAACDGHNLIAPSHWLASRGAYGCLRSHLQVVQEARQRGLPSVLIFEDDVALDPSFRDHFARSISDLPSAWDMLFLGAFHKHEPIQVSQHLYRVSQAYATYAYALNHTIFDRFIASNAAARAPVDDNNLALQKQSNCFCFLPNLAWVRPLYSDAQERFSNYWFLRESLVLPGSEISRFVADSLLILAYHNIDKCRSLARAVTHLTHLYATRAPRLDMAIVEQGLHPTLRASDLPEHCRYSLLKSDQPFDRGMCFNAAVRNADASKQVYVFCDADVFLENRDIRGNIAMCHKYDCATGFDRVFDLTEKDTDRFLADHSLSLSWFDPAEYPTVRHGNDFAGCCFFHRQAFTASGGWIANQPDRLKLRHQRRLTRFLSPNHALRLRPGPQCPAVDIARLYSSSDHDGPSR